VDDWHKTKAQLIEELQQLRQQTAKISAAPANTVEQNRAPTDLAKTLHLLIQQLPIGVQVFDPNGLCLDVNQAFIRTFGLTHPEQVIGGYSLFTEAMIWEDGSPCEAKDYPLLKCLQTGLTQPPITLGVQRPDGAYTWTIVAAFPLAEPETAQPMGAVVTFFDITEQKNTEQREKLAYEFGQQLTTLLDPEVLLRRTVNRLREVFGYYQVQVYMLEKALGTPVNQSSSKDMLVLQESTGEAGRELKRRSHAILVGAKRSLVARAARLMMPVVANDVSRNPNHLPNPLLPHTQSEVAIPLTLEHRLIGVLDIQHTVTNYFSVDKIRTLQIVANQLSIALSNAQLFAENARRLAIIENSSELIALANLKNGQIIYINPAGARLVGYKKPEEMMGKSVEEFYSSEGLFRLRQEILPIIFKEGVWRGESQLRQLNGNTVFVEQTLFAIPNNQGWTQTIATIITDITQRKQAESERATMQAVMFQSAKLASVGELASGVAHEINNPLYVIREFADLMVEDTPSTHPNYRKLQTIIRSADRIAGIVKNLLTFARPSETQVGLVDLSDVWQLTYDLVGQSFRKHSILLEVDIPSNIPKIKARTQQLQQVLLNLVMNARDALNEKFPDHHPNKRITIKAGLGHDTFLNTSPLPVRQAVYFTIRDEGIGISPEHQPRLFSPFFTTKRPNRGTGLGLSVSHKIIEDHQGRIEVKSEPGNFTEFTLIFPIDGVG
jgi:PAS domain S-box-containing protein